MNDHLSKSGSALFFYLGSFPYARRQLCQVQGCRSNASRFVCFRHVRICVLLLCDECAERAESFDRYTAVLSFDRQLVDGEVGGARQNFHHQLRGRHV